MWKTRSATWGRTTAGVACLTSLVTVANERRRTSATEDGTPVVRRKGRTMATAAAAGGEEKNLKVCQAFQKLKRYDGMKNDESSELRKPRLFAVNPVPFCQPSLECETHALQPLSRLLLPFNCAIKPNQNVNRFEFPRTWRDFFQTNRASGLAIPTN